MRRLPPRRGDDPSGKMRKHRRERAAGSPFAGGVVAVAFVFIIIFIILGLRWTGILDRRTLVRLDISSLAAEDSHADLAVQRDSGAHEDGVELEYNSQKCTVSLARAAAIDGPPAAAAEAAKLRGGVTAEQVWTPYIVPVAGTHDSIDAAELWRKRASSAISRLVTAVKDASVLPGEMESAMGQPKLPDSTKLADAPLVVVGSCGLGALQEATVRLFPGASHVVCSEQSAAGTEIAMEHMQRRVSGDALLVSSVVLAPGPSLIPRLGSALSGKVSLNLSPIESTFLKPAAGVAYSAYEACLLLAPGGSGAIEFAVEEMQTHLGDGHDTPHSHNHQEEGETKASTRGSSTKNPLCDLEGAYSAAAAGTLRRQAVMKGEVERLVNLAGCSIATRSDTRLVPPGVTDLASVGLVVFTKPKA